MQYNAFRLLVCKHVFILQKDLKFVNTFFTFSKNIFVRIRPSKQKKSRSPTATLFSPRLFCR
ncbi:hypothetical protein C3L55_04775 [Veillonellaceae bacterium M1-70]|nr:hypothetical protein [Veillonellaceae bacterium M1-70]